MENWGIENEEEAGKVKIIHISDGWEGTNGAANIARMIAEEQEKAGHRVRLARWASVGELRSADQVWVHCAWKPCLWWAALWGRDVHWMPEASYDPMRLAYHGWKKWLVGPIERFFLRRAAVVVAACGAEAEWIRAYEPRVKRIEVTDVKRFFGIENGELRIENEGKVGDKGRKSEDGRTEDKGQRTEDFWGDGTREVHLLYLGRRHPLKGVEYLERALRELGGQKTEDRRQRVEDRGQSMGSCCELRVVSDAFAEEKEKVWEWCDVLVLPTLSENFGLVVAEALERGKRVITTDGAPAWGGCGDCGGRLVYLEGYRDGTPDDRVRLLSGAIEGLVRGRQVCYN